MILTILYIVFALVGTITLINAVVNIAIVLSGSKDKELHKELNIQTIVIVICVVTCLIILYIKDGQISF